MIVSYIYDAFVVVDLRSHIRCSEELLACPICLVGGNSASVKIGS